MRQRVAAAVIEEGGKILIAMRGKGSHLQGKWEFPGGKVEGGESPEQALKRELLEELGIETEIGQFLCASAFDYPHHSVELLAYRVSYVSGNFTPMDHEEIRWVSPAELIGYDFAEADIPIARRIIGR